MTPRALVCFQGEKVGSLSGFLQFHVQPTLRSKLWWRVRSFKLHICIRGIMCASCWPAVEAHMGPTLRRATWWDYSGGNSRATKGLLDPEHKLCLRWKSSIWTLLPTAQWSIPIDFQSRSQICIKFCGLLKKNKMHCRDINDCTAVEQLKCFQKRHHSPVKFYKFLI